jgi:hypothetical protein
MQLKAPPLEQITVVDLLLAAGQVFHSGLARSACIPRGCFDA